MRFAGPGERGGELWQADLQTAQSEALFPGVRVSGYDVSRDGSRIVFAALDDRGTSHIWLASTDRRTAPRLLSPREADSPHFGVNGGIYYRSTEGGASSIYRLSVDGNTQNVVARPVVFFLSVSPDDAWLVVRVEAAPDADSSQENFAFPTAGGTPIRLCDGSSCEVDWTPNGKSLVMRLGGHFSSSSLGRTVLLALQPGEMLPALPSEGIRSEANLAGLHVIHAWDGAVYPSDDVPLAAVVKSMTERNIYRIPLP